MRILGIETSTMAGSVAILADERVVAEYMLHTHVTHTERLMAVIDHLLQATTLRIDEIDAIAVSTGPGSFTGLRIGVTTAKSLAYSLHKPVVGIPSLDALAAHYLFTECVICPLLDARKREVYAALYRNNGAQINRLSDYMVIAPKLLLQQITEPVLVLGDGVSPYRHVIESTLGTRVLFADAAHNTPRASLVAQLGYGRLMGGEQDDCFTVTPLYVRKSDAEIHWERRHRPVVPSTKPSTNPLPM